jgi:hypothetical protein
VNGLEVNTSRPLAWRSRSGALGIGSHAEVHFEHLAPWEESLEYRE